MIGVISSLSTTQVNPSHKAREREVEKYRPDPKKRPGKETAPPLPTTATAEDHILDVRA